jgi:polysaccharide chain length determinant protein (PEP-CTERM system associated)
MINPVKAYTLDEYIEILRRRIWFVVIPFVLIVSGACIYAIFAPRQYKASTLVLVSPQRVPEAFVQATVTSKVEERLQSIAQEVMSRTRLEQVITEFRLYENERKRLSREEVVELMQKNIQVSLPTKKEEKGYFTISYIGADPNTVTTVANRLSSLFIEENLKLREQQAVGTTEFLATELTQSKARLDQLETAVTQYKRRFMGQLPEQRDTNLKLLEQLQNQYQRVGESLRAAQDRKLFIQKQLTDLELPIGSPSPVPVKEGQPSLGKTSSLQKKTASSPAVIGVGGSYESQKESLIRALEDLRTKYTENHPDVIGAKKMLADLEIKKNTYGARIDPRYRELNNQLVMTDMAIKRLEEEERNMAAQMGKYRARIEQTPEREQDMASLMREHHSTKESYERLLKKSQDAQQAENLEKRQKGEQFRVIDPARLPEKPFSPDVPKILLISLLAGLGGGIGLAFLREQMDRSFHDAGDVEIALGLKVLATIPRIEEKAA